MEAISSPTILLESDHLLVLADLRVTDDAVVSFATFTRPGVPMRGFGDEFLQSIGFSAVFVIARMNHWWQVPERDALCAAVRDATKAYRARIAYGASMGGYGALALGRDMGCTRILAIAPQTILSDPAVDMHPGWRAAIAERPILRDAVSADLRGFAPHIVYDPYRERDRQHVAHLRERAPIIERRFPFAGHKILRTLHECGILAATTTALLRDDEAFDVTRKRYADARGRSPGYLVNRAGFAIASGHADAARRIAAKLKARSATTHHEQVMAMLADAGHP